MNNDLKTRKVVLATPECMNKILSSTLVCSSAALPWWVGSHGMNWQRQGQELGSPTSLEFSIFFVRKKNSSVI